MKRIGSMLRRWLRPQARDEASPERRGQGPYRTEAGEHGVGAAPARVVFAPANDWVFWAGEDEEGLLVVGSQSLARLRPGESTPRQIASRHFATNYALGRRGVVWLKRSDGRTEVWRIEPGQESPRRIAESVGMPDGIVAHADGIYWGTHDADEDPDNPKLIRNANARIFSAGFDGGAPVEVVRRQWFTQPLFGDSRAVAWYETSVRPAIMRVFEATVAGVAETTQFPLGTGGDDLRTRATTIDATAVYTYDPKAGGIVTAPRRGGEPRLLARSRWPALALASHAGALYAIVGDGRRAPREIWQVDLATSEVSVLGHFVAEDSPGGGYSRYALAIGRTAVYVYGGRRLLSVPRMS